MIQPNTTLEVPIINGIYSARIHQISTGNPIANILQNTLGTITWTYISTGNYTATLDRNFTATNKIICLATTGYGTTPTIILSPNSPNTLVLQYRNDGTLINDWDYLSILIIEYK